MTRTRMPIDDFDIFSLMANAMSLQPLYRDWKSRNRDGEPLRQEPLAQRDAPISSASANEPLQRRWLERLDHWFWKREQRALEKHLAGSTDIYDLEVKIREIERGAPRWSH